MLVPCIEDVIQSGARSELEHVISYMIRFIFLNDAKEDTTMIDPSVVTALIAAALRGPGAFSAAVDAISARRKTAAYEADKAKAHTSCLTLQPDMVLLEAVLFEADRRGDHSAEIRSIRRTRDFLYEASPTRAGRKKASRPKKAGKKKAAPKKKKAKAKKAAPKKRVARKKAAPKKRKAAKRKAR